eukprot:scaffold1724_cov341-Pavlova_lutheri.AAC.33
MGESSLAESGEGQQGRWRNGRAGATDDGTCTSSSCMDATQKERLVTLLLHPRNGWPGSLDATWTTVAKSKQRGVHRRPSFGRMEHRSMGHRPRSVLSRPPTDCVKLQEPCKPQEARFLPRCLASFASISHAMDWRWVAFHDGSCYGENA